LELRVARTLDSESSKSPSIGDVPEGARQQRPPAEWVVVLFDTERDVVDVYPSSPDADVRAALNAVYAPEMQESVRCAVGQPVAIDSEHVAVVVVFRGEQTTEDYDTEWVVPGATVRQIGTMLASRKQELREALAFRRSKTIGWFLLDPDYRVVSRWISPEYAMSPLAPVYQPEKGRLPAFVERVVRRMTSLDVADAPERRMSAYLLPGVVIQAIRFTTPDGGNVSVWLETLGARHMIRSATTKFRISVREREVLSLLFDGHSIADIARHLFIAESTVADHVKRVITKTGARNRVEMAAKILGWPSDRDGFSAARPPEAN
jgi:DNA-binding CsgD family transcriptional regulator